MRSLSSRIRNKNSVSRLGRSWLTYLVNSISLLSLFVQTKVYPSSLRTWPLFISSRGKLVRLHVGSGSDVTVLREVFVDRAYELPIGAIPKTIIDLGANVGFSAIWFALNYPEAIIHAYEPDPDNFLRLISNTAPFPNIHVFREAVTERSGTIKLYVATGKGIASSVYARRGLAGISVASTTIDEAIDRIGGSVDLVKFDIEGAELKAFASCKRLHLVKLLIGEVHPDLFNAPVSDFIRLFAGYSVETFPSEGVRILMRAAHA